MHYIVETVEQLERLKNTQDSCFIALISNNDNTHPKLVHPSVLYLRPLSDIKGYTVVIQHTEGFSLDFSKVYEVLVEYKEIYCLDSKYHSYFIDIPLIDINYNILEAGEKPKDTKGDMYTINEFYQRTTGIYRHVNEIIPLSKLYEYWESVFVSVEKYCKSVNSFYSSYSNLYKTVEEKGIKIDTRCFADHFTPHDIGDFYDRGKVYTHYNLYNTTMRPTNAFNGINFLALNKENQSRKCFIPQNDYFVEFDFDAYHVRLIANLIQYELPLDTSIHTFFGKQYFNKDILTEEEYQESKKITFQNIYGGIKSEYKDIPFYKAVARYLDDLWETYQYGGAIQLPTGKILKVEEGMNTTKLFNYMIQNLETKTNVELLTPILEILKSKKSFINLIVYDSFLLDFSLEDGKDLLVAIVNEINSKNYTVKARYGRNYGSLIKSDYL